MKYVAAMKLSVKVFCLSLLTVALLAGSATSFASQSTTVGTGTKRCVPEPGADCRGVVERWTVEHHGNLRNAKSTGASAAAGATGATFALAVGAGSVVLMSVLPAEAGRLIVSGARGAGWKTRAITTKSFAVSQAGVPVNMTAAITPATTALLLTGSVKVRLAATMVSPSGSRTTSYKTITLKRAAPPPVVD